MYSVVIHRHNLDSEQWQRVKKDIQIIGFDQKASGIWERIEVNKNDREMMYEGTRNWLKKRGIDIDKMIFERFTVTTKTKE